MSTSSHELSSHNIPSQSDQPLSPEAAAERGSHAPFATTRWSMVLLAGATRSPAATSALATLCECYWYPLYAFVRRRGYRVDDARDLTQSFFADLLEREALRVANPQRGRFRSFLLASFENFLIKDWRKATAQKRGGNVSTFSLNIELGEHRYLAEPFHDMTAERIFERRFATTLIDHALMRLQTEYDAAGNGPLFAQLKPYLAGSLENAPYSEIAALLDLSVGAIKVSVHRLRQRFRITLKKEIAQTVASSADVDEELRHLWDILGS